VGEFLAQFDVSNKNLG